MTAMATAIAVLEPDVLPPLGEILDVEAMPVMEYHQELVQASKQLRTSLMCIAFYGFRIRLCEGWMAFGLESGPRGEDAYREMLGVPRSTWFRYVRIGQFLHQLPLADLERIPVTNAELLMQVNPALMNDFEWVQEAKLLAPKALAELICSRNKAVGDEREPLSTLCLRIPFLAKRAIEEMLEAFQHKNELASKGQALELMVADLHNDSSLLASVDQARQLLAGVMASLTQKGATETEETAWVTMAREILDESYEKAVQTARSKTYRRNQNHEGRS